MKKLLMTCTLLAMTASMASAQLNLYWDDCGGGTDMTFTCTANTGARFPLVATFIAPVAIPDYFSSTTTLELISDGTVLPDWWKGGAGECRQGSFVSSDPGAAGLAGCANAYEGVGLFSAVVGYQSNWNGDPRRASITYDAARSEPSPNPIAAGQEVIASMLEITRTKTTGTGACAGCARPVCIVVKQIVVQTASGGTFILHNPPGPAGAQYVTWQGGVTGPGNDCPNATPARNRTWGEVKSLYR